jgi:hypothetical protein
MKKYYMKKYYMKKYYMKKYYMNFFVFFNDMKAKLKYIYTIYRCLKIYNGN